MGWDDKDDVYIPPENLPVPSTEPDPNAFAPRIERWAEGLGDNKTWADSAAPVAGIDAGAVGGVPPGAQPPGLPNAGTDHEALRGALDNSQAAQTYSKVAWNIPPPPPGAPVNIMQAGEDYLKNGGRRGRSAFEEAFTEGPQDVQRAVEGAQALTEQRNDATRPLMEQEAARQAQAFRDDQAQRALEQKGIQERQRQLDEATTKYTADLQDSGKFWRNPGNIISAIAYSLMPIVAPNDPSIGIRAINQAIDRDMGERKAAADTALGQLSSNLHGYAKIAGDRQSGDLLAEASAKRVAADQVAAVAARFDNPISRKKAEAVIADLRSQSARDFMQAYRSSVYVAPAVMPKAMENAFGGKSGLPGAYQSFNSQGAPPVSNGPAPVQGTQRPGQASPYAVPGTRGPGGQPVVPGASAGRLGAANGTLPGGSPTTAPMGSPGFTEDYKAVEERYPGAMEEAQRLNKDVLERAKQESGYAYDPSKYPAFVKRVEELHKETDAQAEGLAQRVGPQAQQYAIVRKLNRDMDQVQATGVNPNDLLNHVYGRMGVDAEFWQTMDRWATGEPKGDPNSGTYQAQLLQKRRAEAAVAFRNTIAMARAAYQKDAGGARSNANESKGDTNISDIISKGSDWPSLKAFATNQSQVLQAQLSAAMAGSTPQAQTVFYLRTGIRLPKLATQGN